MSKFEDKAILSMPEGPKPITYVQPKTIVAPITVEGKQVSPPKTLLSYLNKTLHHGVLPLPASDPYTQSVNLKRLTAKYSTSPHKTESVTHIAGTTENGDEDEVDDGNSADQD